MNKEEQVNSNNSDKEERRHSIDSETKMKILDLVKDGSVRVKDAALTYGVNHRTIYGWLSQSALPGQKNSTELLRLKRENKALLQLVGQLTAEIQKSKKKNW